jgi:hypothetical protein
MEPEGSLPHSQVPATCPYTYLIRWTIFEKDVIERKMFF